MAFHMDCSWAHRRERNSGTPESVLLCWLPPRASAAEEEVAVGPSGLGVALGGGGELLTQDLFS